MGDVSENFKKPLRQFDLFGNRRGAVVSLRASERKVWSSKLYKNTTGIRQKGRQEFKVLRYSSTKSGSKASV